MMDLYDALEEKQKEPAGDLYDLVGEQETSTSGDLYNLLGGEGPAKEKPSFLSKLGSFLSPPEKPVQWSETTSGYVEEIAARSPGVGLFPFAAYAPQAAEPMPKLGKEYPGPFGAKPPEMQETRFLKRPPTPIIPRRLPGPEGISFEVPSEIETRRTDEPSFLRDVVVGTLKKFGETAIGSGETVASLVGGMAEFLNPIPGLAGVGKILTGASPEEQAQTIQDLQSRFHPYLVYEPQTEEGKKGKQLLDWAFQSIQKVGETFGGAVQEISAPLGKTISAGLGATVGGSLDLILPVLILGRLGKTAKKTGRLMDVEKPKDIENILKEIKKEVEAFETIPYRPEPVQFRYAPEWQPPAEGETIPFKRYPKEELTLQPSAETPMRIGPRPPEGGLEIPPTPSGEAEIVYHGKTKGDFKGGELSIDIGSDADIMGKGFYFGSKDYVSKYGTPESYSVQGKFATNEEWVSTLKKYSEKPIQEQRRLSREELKSQGYVGVKSEHEGVGVVWDKKAIVPSELSEPAKRALPKEPWEMTPKEFNEWFPRLRSVEQKPYERLYRSKITEYDDLPTAMQKYSIDFGYENPGLVARFKNVKPEDNVDIYRAISKDDPVGKIEPGDWVAIEYKYAKTHGAAGYGDVGSKIVKMKVPAKDVVWAGTSADEYFYAPQKLRDSSIKSTHEAVIKQALSEGKPVPPEVLKDYPDLAPLSEPAKRALIRIEGKTVNGLAQDILSETPAKQNAAIEAVKKAVEEGKITQKDALEHFNNEMQTIAREKVLAGGELNATFEAAQRAGMTFTEKIAKEIKPDIQAIFRKLKGEEQPPKATPYLNEKINFGGEIRSRGSVIAEMQKQGTSQKLIDSYMMGAKTIKTGKPEILGLGGVGELQKVYESLRGLKKRTEPLPKYARSINLERQAIKEEFKNFETELADLLPQKKVQTWDETGKLADEILSDYQRIGQTLHKAEKGYALNAAEIEAARRINVTAVNRLAEMAETKGIEKTNELIKTYANNIFKTVSDASSEAGRALNIHKKFVAPARLAISLKSLKNGMNERQFKEFQEIAPLLSKEFEGLTEMDMGKVQKFIDRLPDPKIKDYFYEFWYNSILSGIPTHMVNWAGNTMWQAWNIAIHHPISASIDAMISKFTGRERQIFFNEIFPMLAGIKTGVKKGWGGVKEVVRTGQATEFQTKWDREMGGGTVSAFERSPNAFLRAVAPVITAPSRALRAMDIWANSIAYDVKMKGLISQEGLKRGLEGERLERFERNFQPPEDMMKEAGEYAKYITFMDDPGKISTAILNLREKIPLGRLLVPFVTTIGNLLKRGLEMTPGIGAFMGKGRPPAEIIAKQIEGSIISFWILKKSMDGDITGPRPEDPNEAKSFDRQKKLPWSIRIGDTWFQYRRMEPFNTVIASTAIAYDKIVKAKSQDDAANIFYDVVKGIWENLLDSSYLSGATQMLQRHGNVANMGLRQLSSMVPFSGFWRSVNRALETVFEDNAKVREVKTVLGAFSQVIPGLWKEVPAKLNVWGEEIELPGNALRQWLPWKYSETGGDLLEDELDRLQIYPSHPTKQIMIGEKKIELPEEFYRDYAIHFGSLAKQRLTKIINSSGYQRMPEEEKQKALDSELRRLRYGEAMRAKREYVKEFGMPTEEMNLKKKIGG